MSATPPLVAHVIERLTVGGMENGVVNLINNMPTDRYRHAVICLRHATDFRFRIRREGVEIVELHKGDGKSLNTYADLWKALRRLKPAIVHTRNLPAVDMVAPAFLAGVPAIVHGEHGRDALEVAGANRKYNLIRRVLSPVVGHYITVSKDIEFWISDVVGIPARKVTQIYNGVDSVKFRPRLAGDPLPEGFPFPKEPGAPLVIGTVGRLQTVKDQPNLAKAFVDLLDRYPGARDRVRLAIVGDGDLGEEVRRILAAANALDQAWMPGARDDTGEIYRALDIFCLPSVNEGISNTILEAMSSGLPVVATRVGGNPELVTDGETGLLVPPQDPRALADAFIRYLDNPGLVAAHGQAARARIDRDFSMDAMMTAYAGVYDRVLRR
ncbi:MAG: TIGR03088 family PEP-CTERM/XrtA system glycosyltransferase [Magnetospiraceae bacterium]